jgi:hypothetical protein
MLRLRFLLPLVYIAFGFLVLVAWGGTSDRQGWGIEPFYSASLPSVLLVRLLFSVPSMGAMLATFGAGVVQYALVGEVFDRLRSWQGKRSS